MKTVTTAEMTCCSCGTTFAIDEILKELRLKDGKTFYCPNGHGQQFTCTPESKISGLSKELEETTDELRDAKAEITRLRCELLKRQTPWWKRLSTR